jgi:hypothetical protein
MQKGEGKPGNPLIYKMNGGLALNFGPSRGAWSDSIYVIPTFAV